VKALPKERPVPSQPPPGLAGIIILSVGAALAMPGKLPAATAAIKDFKNSSRRMDVSKIN
jgi:hypothetical protein